MHCGLAHIAAHPIAVHGCGDVRSALRRQILQTENFTSAIDEGKFRDDLRYAMSVFGSLERWRHCLEEDHRGDLDAHTRRDSSSDTRVGEEILLVAGLDSYGVGPAEGESVEQRGGESRQDTAVLAGVSMVEERRGELLTPQHVEVAVVRGPQGQSEGREERIHPL